LAVLTIIGGIFTYIRWRTWGIKKRAKVLQQLVYERTLEISSQRDELVVLNEELRSSQEEVMAQRDSLEEKNVEIERMNTNLEKIVADRTQVLEKQNKKLSEYAFINAHKLRAPLASILGIINLLTLDTDKEEQRKLLDHLDKASLELDKVVRDINQMLEEGFDKEKGDS
jgi:signal transduction histidine kinase